MESFSQQGIDSRAMFAAFMRNLPMLLVLAAAGAILGSGLNVFLVLLQSRDTVFVSETEYYIEFAPGRYEVRDYYNDFTWNDVLATDLILGRAMELLGDQYERTQVKDSITADILSDVRYLTITVRSKTFEEAEAIKNALQTALEEFGAKKKEFESIEKIEDLEIVQEKRQYFAWRAAVLGAVVLLCIGIFEIAFRICAGSAFYTKQEIVKTFGIPVYGMTFKENANRDSFLQKQYKMLEQNLKLLNQNGIKIYLLDASEGVYVEAFLKNITSQTKIKTSFFKKYDRGQELSGATFLAVIPFGKTYREKITDEMEYVKLHGASVRGAVIVEADNIWQRIYYACYTWNKKEVNES